MALSGAAVLAINEYQHWKCDTLAWARAEGCTSPLPNDLVYTELDYLSDDYDGHDY
jgi:hypothetical protein